MILLVGLLISFLCAIFGLKKARIALKYYRLATWPELYLERRRRLLSERRKIEDERRKAFSGLNDEEVKRLEAIRKELEKYIVQTFLDADDEEKQVWKMVELLDEEEALLTEERRRQQAEVDKSEGEWVKSRASWLDSRYDRVQRTLQDEDEGKNLWLDEATKEMGAVGDFEASWLETPYRLDVDDKVLRVVVRVWNSRASIEAVWSAVWLAFASFVVGFFITIEEISRLGFIQLSMPHLPHIWPPPIWVLVIIIVIGLLLDIAVITLIMRTRRK